MVARLASVARRTIERHGQSTSPRGAGGGVSTARRRARHLCDPSLSGIHRIHMMLCDMQDEAQLTVMFERIATQWGKLDFLVHAISFAPKDDSLVCKTQIASDPRDVGEIISLDVAKFRRPQQG